MSVVFKPGGICVLPKFSDVSPEWFQIVKTSQIATATLNVIAEGDWLIVIIGLMRLYIQIDYKMQLL